VVKNTFLKMISDVAEAATLVKISSVTSTIVTDAQRDFPQSLQANVGILS
jgi:hypothetical protein